MAKRYNKKELKMKYLITLAILIILLVISIIFITKATNKKSILASGETTQHNVEENIEKIENNIIYANIEDDEKSNTVINIRDNNIDINTSSNTSTKNSTKNNTEKTNTSVSTSAKTSSNKSSKSGLPVLMYHFFYDKSKRKAPDNNWIEISDFEKQMKYLSENNYYFPTWEEVEAYIDGKKALPEKSVVITVDDGDDSFFELAVPIIQKYNIKATSFIITSWYGYRANSKQTNISYQSHSDNMHKAGSNGKGVMLSWSYDKVLKDLKNSSKILGGATIFCYPFGQYSDSSQKVLKEAGYKLAFTTKEGRIYKGAGKYKLPRVRVLKTTSLSEFKELVK